MIRKRVIVSGQVQGVCFRDACRATATTQGVRGWVRNLPDRRVEAVFEGEPQAVGHLVDWVYAGPPAALVDGVQVHEEEPEDLTEFEVLPTPSPHTNR